jgi:hypothetical protein
MKVFCKIEMKYGSKMEFWCEDELQAATRIKELKEKGVEIIKTDISQPKPENTDNLH